MRSIHTQGSAPAGLQGACGRSKWVKSKINSGGERLEVNTPKADVGIRSWSEHRQVRARKWPSGGKRLQVSCGGIRSKRGDSTIKIRSGQTLENTRLEVRVGRDSLNETP